MIYKGMEIEDHFYELSDIWNANNKANNDTK